MSLLILVAEDDPAMRLSISDCLEFCGYSVITAEDGQQALSMVEKYHPHLLISDIKMPKKNGYELLKSIRKLPQYRLLPVILLTECNATIERIHGYQVGCDLYLPKPFEMEELRAIVRNLLERSQIIHSELRFSQNEHHLAASEGALELTKNATDDRDDPESENKLDLTKRETEVLQQLIEGHSNIEIGQKLHLSHRTIEKYVSSLLRKSQLNNRIELVRYAIEHHLVQ
jgi:DNA-binding NarL/FixJ family response regulator